MHLKAWLNFSNWVLYTPIIHQDISEKQLLGKKCQKNRLLAYGKNYIIYIFERVFSKNIVARISHNLHDASSFSGLWTRPQLENIIINTVKEVRNTAIIYIARFRHKYLFNKLLCSWLMHMHEQLFFFVHLAKRS